MVVVVVVIYLFIYLFIFHKIVHKVHERPTYSKNKFSKKQVSLVS